MQKLLQVVDCFNKRRKFRFEIDKVLLLLLMLSLFLYGTNIFGGWILAA